MDPTALTLLVVLALLASVAGSGWVARGYRRAMLRAMQAPVPAAEGAWPEPEAPAARPASAGLADNRRAERRLTALLVGLSAALALSSSALELALTGTNDPRRLPVLLTVSLMYAWPVLPALAVLRRWTRTRLLAVMLAWLPITGTIVAWRSVPGTEMGAWAGLLVITLPPLLMTALISLGDAPRAIAPWLMPGAFLLVGASMLGVGWLFQTAMQPQVPAWLVLAMTTVGLWPSLALAALLPWLVAWWPVRRIGRAIGAAWRRRWVSELLALFTLVWALALAWRALGSVRDIGPAAAALLLPLLLIPPAVRLWPAHRRGEAAPTLLVLRVFQRDAAVRRLFDEVIERWRLSGRVLLIAGTDLLERTLGADDVYDHLDGRLAARFVTGPAALAQRLAEVDPRPDPEGRYRVDEFYCHDHTWKPTLDALVARSDRVLMDLRGLQSRNLGCLHELGVLTRAGHLQAVVLLADRHTDRAAATQAMAGAAADRFAWIDVDQVDRSTRQAVLAALFAPGAGPARAQRPPETSSTLPVT